MPFQECSIVGQRVEFCRLASAPGTNLRELCRRFGIAPATGYKWLGRFHAEGDAGLGDRSRRPRASPERTPDALEERVLAVRLEHPCWGGRKIRRVLQNEGAAQVPAASTITAILRRHGRLDGPGAQAPRAFTRFEHAAPNDLWQMDFKGHFALHAGRCHPLTVLDDHSRYSLTLEACADERLQTVRERLTRTFRRYGLPLRILADNGPPWGSAGQGRYTALGVWLLDLGVDIVHGRPRHPQTQGKEERFHRTLKAEVLDGRSFADLTQAQRAFDAWREVYNARRPHEALGMELPASRYRISSRAMPERIAEPEYEPQAHVRKVFDTGWFSFRGRSFPCPKAFIGKRIALRHTDVDHVLDVCYRSHVLAQIDLRQDAGKTVHHVPEHPYTLSPV
jgi:transposase InsO family protein